MKRLVVGLLCLLFTLSTNAFIVTKTGGKGENKHVFVLGNADKLGDLFLRSAQTKILRYKDMYPK